MPISIARLVLLEDSLSCCYECDPNDRIATLDPKGKVLVQQGKEEVWTFHVEMHRLADPEVDLETQYPWIQDRLLLKMLRRAERIAIDETVHWRGGGMAADIARERLAEFDGPYNVISPGGWYGHHHILPYGARDDYDGLLDLPGLHSNETFWLPKPHFLGIVSTYGDVTAMWMDLSRVVRISFKPDRR